MRIALPLIFRIFVATTVYAQPTRIGAIMPLSGAVAPWGERVRIGLEVANESQGNQFAISFEDEGACEAQKALTAYRKLVNIDKVKVVFLACLSGTEAIAPIAKNDSVLLLSLGLLNDSTIHSGAKLVNLATEIGTEAVRLADRIAREKPRSLAGVFFGDTFGQEFSRVLAERLTTAGFPFVARDDADAQLQSFKSLIMRWKKLKIDVLVTTLSDRQQVTLLREMHELGFAPKIFSTYALEAFAPVKADRVYYEGIEYTHPVNSAEAAPERIQFNAALAKREKPGQSTNVNAFFAYDGLKFLANGLEQCRGADPSCLYQYFTSLGTQHGISGDMIFQRSGALERPYGLKKVLNGEFVWLDKSGLTATKNLESPVLKNSLKNAQQ